MAEGNSEETVTFNPQHNSAARDEIISDCATKMLDIRQQRRALNKQAAAVRGRLKDCGVETQVFDLNVRITEMEKQGRVNYLQDLAICYHAINPNGGLEWLEATGRESTLVTPISLDEAIAAGREAGLAGRDIDTNPFVPSEPNYKHWNEGWDTGQAELAADMDPVPAAPTDEAAAPA